MSELSDFCSSEAVGGEGLVELGNRFVAGGLGTGGNFSLLGNVELVRLDLSALFESSNEGSLGPAGNGCDVSEDSEVTVRFHSEDLECVGDNHTLLLVIRVWDTVEESNVTEGSSTTSGFVGEHSTEVLPEHAGWSKGVLERFAGVGVATFVFHILPDELVAEERS